MKEWVLFSAMGLMIAYASYSDSPYAQITFQVKDDAGYTVSGAVVKLKTFERWVPGPEFGKDIYHVVEGLTDTNGVVTLGTKSLDGNVQYWVCGGGEYYDNMMKMEIGGREYYRQGQESFHFRTHFEGKWQPWNPVVDIELKPVYHPIPMYARRLVNNWPRCRIPQFGQPMGFDLIKSDWIAPYGKGETADFFFTLTVTNYGERKVDRVSMYDAVLSVTFGNDGDGIQGFLARPYEGSVFRSSRLAPESGYSNALVKVSYQHEKSGRTDEREDQNYFYRIRSLKDKHGNIVSALYGKIYGDISFNYRGELSFVYYLNPTPNDRNLEFDPKRNLFQDLKDSERVSTP